MDTSSDVSAGPAQAARAEGGTRAGPLLAVEGVSKSFGGVQVLQGVDLAVSAGQRVSLIGSNGAGKTTLFNIITRLTPPDAGTVHFSGRDLLHEGPHNLVTFGLARTFQHTALFPSLTVAQNVTLPLHAMTPPGLARSSLHLPGFRRRRKDREQRARDVLRFLDLAGLADAAIPSLPYPVQKRIEIARALVTGPTLLILDEPAGGINMQEATELAAMIREAQEQFAFSLLLIEHNMRFVMGLSDYIYVLDHGVPLADGSPSDIATNQTVIDAYLGSER